MAPINSQLVINLSAIQSNWRLLRERLVSDAVCGAVVKANAYGLGAKPVADALFTVGCRHFFVASLDEALELPEPCQSQATVFILSGLRPGEELECLQKGFVPVLSTLSQVDRWVSAGAGFAGELGSVLKVDTGMGRSGMLPQEFVSLCGDEPKLEACRPQFLMSHLACSEQTSHTLNRQQLDNFVEMQRNIKRVIPDIKFSLANSSGIFLGRDYQFDMVRPGAALYGVNPLPEQINPMSPVVSLRLPILQIKTIIGPATVGYGGTFGVSEGKSVKVAIVQGGYADGILRCLGGKAQAVLNGQRVPLIGRVSMDTVAFDVGEVVGEIREELDSVTLIGEGIGVDDVAQKAGTIGYEILTSLGNRYRRSYIAN